MPIPKCKPLFHVSPVTVAYFTWACYRNYVKFLVDRNGKPVKRFGPGFDPLDFEGDVRLLLAGKDPTPPECLRSPGKKVCNVDRILGVERPL